MKMMKHTMGFIALASLCLTTGCVKDQYNPNPDGPQLPSKENYFDFNLRETSRLSVNYNVPGLNAIIEVYDQNPMQDDSNRKKDGIKPIYVAYTTDGKYDDNMIIPTAVSEAYVYTNSLNAPQCVKLEAGVNGYSFDATKQPAETHTRNSTMGSFPQFASGIIDVNKFPYEVAMTVFDKGQRNDNLYAITAWQLYGWECVNMNYYTKPKAIGAAAENVTTVTDRLSAFLEAQRLVDGNKSLLRNPDEINIKVPSTATEGMSVNVSYVGERASFFNTLGYYYYPDNGQTLTAEEFYKLKKYIIIPNVDANHMASGETVKLLYFDENGVQSDKFPANYVIGWFSIANGFGSNHPRTGQGGYPNGGVIRHMEKDAYTASAYSERRTSCMSDDKGADRRFISLYDTKSKLRVFGIEDFLYQEADDYMDVMFFVETSIDLGGGTLPPVGPVEPDPKPVVWSVSGTVAFEDIWPHGGDYDLNDVIVEYNRDITFGKDNIVTNIKETYKPVQKIGSAGNNNFFACQYSTMGKIAPTEGVILEPTTGSFVIEASAKTIAGKTYVIDRDMTGLGLKQEDAQKDFNPYIITMTYKPENRVEVHLPMHEMTSAADKSLMNKDNAYYIASSKIYPFAIDIPIADFIMVDEKKRIDSEGQYPSFKTWAESKGEQAKNWYLQDKGKK